MPQDTANRQIMRWLVMASIAIGVLYPLIEPQLAPLPAVVLKGLGVGLLAVAALLLARNRDGWLLTGVMAAATAGDVLLAMPGRFIQGAAAFGVGHMLAIALYMRHRQRPLRAQPALVASALIATGLVLPRLLLPGDAGLAVYALLLTGMTAAAFASRFDRRVPLGALMFLVSDALIAVRMQHPGGGMALGLAIWWLYYFGQLLIFTWVSRAVDPQPAR